MLFKRQIKIKNLRHSAFLFGPRMTGKTYLIRDLESPLYMDLLDPERELELRQSPRLFWEQISALQKKSLVIVDEIQRVPVLLDYVQKGIEELELKFILSGSSARKLKRGGANLLGGRAIELKLHPLTYEEIGQHFDLAKAIQFGTLPKIMQTIVDGNLEDVPQLLRAYYRIYIKEEVQAEALTRNVGAFQRFLQVAAQSNAQIIEFSNVSRECSVPASTVKEYFSILEDTLIGEFLWPWDRSERKKARPKFYFFDCGVVRAIQNRLQDPPTSVEKGFLFETWFIRELVRYRDYMDKPHEFAYWRKGTHEIDILIMRQNKPILAIECKSGREMVNGSTLNAYKRQFPDVPLIVASAHDQIPRKIDSGVEILPWKDALRRYTQAH